MAKMTNCKACGKEIASGAKICPHCGKDQRNFFMKHKIITGILVLIILGIIGTAIGGKGSSSSSSTSASSTATSTQSNKDKLKDSYGINETAKYKDVEMTVTKVEVSNGSEFDKPKDGKEFVIATVKIQNNSDNKLSYNPFYFKVQNSQGQVEDGTFSTVNQDTALKSGELVKGGQVEGSVNFEEPIGDKGLLLQYQDNVFLDNAKLQFKLN